MWRKSENSNATKPLEVEKGASCIYVRRNFSFVEAVETEGQERPAHWEYEENAMSQEAYELYDNAETANAKLAYVAMMTDVDLPESEDE